MKETLFTTIRAQFISSFIHSLLFTFIHFPMKTTFYLVRSKPSFCLLLSLMGLLTSFSPVLSQNYNASIGSGTVGTGNHNVFVGPYAGPSNTTGYTNSFVGYGAVHSNTTGIENSFIYN